MKAMFSGAMLSMLACSMGPASRDMQTPAARKCPQHLATLGTAYAMCP